MRAVATVLLILTGCSHTTPYYAPAAMTSGTDEFEVHSGAVVSRVLLVGDAGAPGAREPVLAELGRWGSMMPERTTIVFLGDNVYPRGLAGELDPEHRSLTRRRLQRQLDVVATSGARGLFIPGNHDWAHGGPDGLLALDRQERAVEAALGPGTFEPSGGCAGPEAIDLDGVRLVVFDSEWFLQELPASPCPDTEARFVTELTRLVAGAGERAVFILAHHPIATHGPHGGFFDWKDHVFPLTGLASWAYVPLPVVGSLYPLVRGRLSVSRQDAGHVRYQRFVEVVSHAVQAHRPIIYAGGHEHGLQVLDGRDAFGYVLVSGAGSAGKITKVTDGDATLFAHAHAGFMCVDVLEDGQVALRVVEPNIGVVFSRWLTKGG